MFERFTERARQVVVLAQEEARTLKHNYIGTEHILLGLLREEEGLAARVLESLEITVERVRAQVVRIVGSGEEVTSGQIPFTPRAKKVLELALREALSLGHNYIGTEHILLGLVRESEGVAAKALQALGIGLEAVREQVQEIIGTGQHAPSGTIPFTPRAKKVLELSLREAMQLGDSYIGTEHILLGLIREGEGVAAQVLIKLDGNLNKVRQQVIQMKAGTPETEEMPAAAAGPAESSGGPESAGPAESASLTAKLTEALSRLDSISDRLTGIERALGIGTAPDDD
jgi:ATP-dependent Clp protease ATP-binding subunit ClpA